MDCKWTCASTKWTVSKATEMWKVEWWCVGIGCVMIERADGVASDLIVGVAVNWEESGRSWRVIAASKSERSRETLFVSHSNGDNNTLKKKKSNQWKEGKNLSFNGFGVWLRPICVCQLPTHWKERNGNGENDDVPIGVNEVLVGGWRRDKWPQHLLSVA